MRRRTIGRPLNKKYFGDIAGALQVTSYFRAGASEVTGEDDTHIVSQRSTNKFLVADTSGGWSEVLTLVDKAEGTLADGEFMVEALLADGTPSRVTRFYNRTLRLTGDIKQKWSIAAAAELDITGITQAVTAVVTVADTSALTTGDTVTITDVVGMVEVNGFSFEVVVLDGTTFELTGINSTGYTIYGSAGVATRAGGIEGATPDIQGA